MYSWNSTIYIFCSGRTERQVAESQKGDNSQVNQVMRVPSKRHERRLSAENRQTGKEQIENR